ncbi:hypothetical protein [Acidisphaera sp. S103]|uniref:hypothetical protein n=1 Tax=Acidisphaera sp. S103 TaxID=1747223 RepID=UPI00131DD6BB|nr:hypothetical protein [Acidisphaera sp. S103]
MDFDELLRRKGNIEALLTTLGAADDLAAQVFHDAAVPVKTWFDLRQLMHVAICFEASRITAAMTAAAEVVRAAAEATKH